MARHWHRTPVRFPPTVWRGLKLRALDYETSAVALVRQALTDALDGTPPHWRPVATRTGASPASW
jgi:hypothetical protein